MSITILEIPIEQAADKTYKVTLDDGTYDLRIKYLYRLTNVAYGTSTAADEFVLYLAPSGGDTLFQASLKTNRDVLEPYRYMDGCPQGELVLRDILAENAYVQGNEYAPERASWDDWGDRFRLLYTYSS